MKKTFKELVLIILGVVAIGLTGIVGCGNLSTEDESGDESDIKSLMSGEYSGLFDTNENNGILSNTDCTDCSGAGGALTISSALQGGLPIPEWYRDNVVRHPDPTITITFEEGVWKADVIQNPTFTGVFNLDYNGDLNFGEKDIDVTAYRHSKFEKEPGSRWVLKELSPFDFSMSEASSAKLIKVEVFVDDELVWSVADPTTLYSFPDEIPTFNPGDIVVVEATIENKNDDGSDRKSYVYLHHDGKRELMCDDSSICGEGDVTPDDEVFTGTYTIGSVKAYHHAGIDIIDGDTIQDPTENADNYNSEAWGMPYKVE